MSKRITVDPVTRIEGHLRIDVEVDGGKVTKAWSSGQMWRGIENILKGRDPREAWLFTQRFCGVCTTVHAIASVRAVENATQTEIPLNAQLIRNLILSAHAMHDHIVHFYHLSALDWVDVVSALDANPAETARLAESLSPWPGNSWRQLAAVKALLEQLIASGQLGIFDDIHVGGLARLAAAIRHHGSLAMVQLHHAGLRSPPDLIGAQPLSASNDEKTGARALATAEVEQLADDFVRAALRAEQAGFDGMLFTEGGRTAYPALTAAALAAAVCEPQLLPHGHTWRTPHLGLLRDDPARAAARSRRSCRAGGGWRRPSGRARRGA